MIENDRNGFVWDVMKRNPHVRRGLLRAGFRGGWLEALRQRRRPEASETIMRISAWRRAWRRGMGDGPVASRALGSREPASGREPRRRARSPRQGLLRADDPRGEARPAPAARRRSGRPLPARAPRARAQGAARLHAERPGRRATSTSCRRPRSRNRGSRSRSSSATTSSTATAPSFRSRWARPPAGIPALVEHGARRGRRVVRGRTHWTFAPMVDIARDPRWGRIVEGAGEDPYLGSVLAAARVRGFQGDDSAGRDRVIASRQALRRLRRGRGRPRLQHRRHLGAHAARRLPAAVQGRRRRRRRHGDERVQRHQRRRRPRATATPSRASSATSGSSTASWSATTPRSSS